MVALATHSYWQDKAACHDAPPDLFITPGDLDDDPFYPAAEALVFCSICSVRDDCLAWAMDNDPVGVWGATTQYQRHQLGRARERAKCPSCGSVDLIYENSIELCLSCGMSWNII